MLDLLAFFSQSLSLFKDLVGSDLFLLTANTLAFFLKSFIFSVLVLAGIKKKSSTNKPLFFLTLMLAGGMLEDFAWIVKLTRTIFFPNISYHFAVFSIRLAWAFKIIQYQSLALFFGSLIDNKYTFGWFEKFSVSLSSTVSTYFLYLAFFQYHLVDKEIRLLHEVPLYQVSITFVLFAIAIPSLLVSLKKSNLRKTPKLLKNQLKTVLRASIIPYIFCDFIQIIPVNFSIQNVADNFPIDSISSVLLTYAIYYCSRRVMGLRFLNFKGHVQSATHFNFIDDFKSTLEQLGHIVTKQELVHVTQNFFKEALRIRQNKTMLYLRSLDVSEGDTNQPPTSPLERCVENFITIHDTSSCRVRTFLQQTKIFINDEIEFSNFYESSTEQEQILQFLDDINADVFVPIFEKQTIIGYIIVEREARVHEFYSDVERDEMVVFASYLGNIINLIKNRNLNTLIEREKSLHEELFHKHQEINQYKESIRSFLSNNKEHGKTGVLFYSNRKFTFGNEAAKELIGINPNAQVGHPITKKLKSIVQNVEQYNTPQRRFALNALGNKLLFEGISHLERNAVIITINYPDASDLIKQQVDLLKNPSEWDYLLYLETTKSGKLINQLIPGSGSTLLNFKIDLLKMALSKEALLLEIPDDDQVPMVEILHHISLRETLHVLTLKDYEKNFETSIKLFGINPIFGNTNEQPLLEKLDGNGTLFIQNIHLVSLETQVYLAEFIQYGYYTVFKSEQKQSSNVRIICSTNQNLQKLVEEGTFSKQLFAQLKKTTISMPTLTALSHQELDTLIDGFTQQALKTDTFKNLLELTDKEKDHVINARPVSLQEFKEKVQQLLISKSKKNNIYQETQFDPAYKVSDPELSEVARMGKKALKDSKAMGLLWHKFKNQNQIAAFLGVNRSSVHRRCKEYNLI